MKTFQSDLEVLLGAGEGRSAEGEGTMIYISVVVVCTVAS
jgi:hypothetical protein